MVFWISHVPGYLVEPIRDDEEFKEAVRIGVKLIKNSLKVDFEGRQQS